MLLASDFLLNGTLDNNNGTFRRFEISPWIAETKNVLSFAHRIRPVLVPDVDPNSASRTTMEHHHSHPPEFTMLAGEFLSVYSHYLPENQSYRRGCQPSKFHAIACSFFLDTAPSLPHYLLTIYHMLDDGGLLINFGPLMYRKCSMQLKQLTGSSLVNHRWLTISSRLRWCFFLFRLIRRLVRTWSITSQ